MKKENIEFILKILLPAISISILIYIAFIEPKQYSRYDVNRDDKVNSADILELRQYLINKGESK